MGEGAHLICCDCPECADHKEATMFNDRDLEKATKVSFVLIMLSTVFLVFVVGIAIIRHLWCL